MTREVEEAASRIWQAYETGETCAPVRDLIGADDVEAAYAVQEINTTRWLAGGRRIVGRKIGLTSKAVQAQLGVDQPDFGMLYDDMLVESGASLPAGAVMQAKVEAEIALILNAPLTKENHSAEDIAAATGHAVAAIEIVGSRIANWDIKIVDTVADNASSGMFVLGSDEVPLSVFDPIECKMSMTKGDGTEVSSGSGAACLGSPLLAAAWLADTMVKVGRPLQAGDILMTGALGPMTGVNAGETYEAGIEGLGSVRVSFTD